MKCGVCGKRNTRLHAGWSNRCLDCCRKATAASVRANSRVRKAVKAGELPAVVGQACADCGKPAVYYDHRDYRKPLDVVPVCRGCNVRRGPGLPYLASISDGKLRARKKP